MLFFLLFLTAEVLELLHIDHMADLGEVKGQAGGRGQYYFFQLHNVCGKIMVQQSMQGAAC